MTASVVLLSAARGGLTLLCSLALTGAVLAVVVPYCC